MTTPFPRLNVALMGSGEYTTGYVPGTSVKSDKKLGVVGLVMFDLKRRGIVGDISIAGVTSSKVSTTSVRSRACPS